MHRVCNVLFCCGFVLNYFNHILQGCFTWTGAIIWLPQCQWSSPEEYGQIHHIDLQWIHGITTTKKKQQKHLHILWGQTVYVTGITNEFSSQDNRDLSMSMSLEDGSTYRPISSIRCTKSHNLNVSHFVVQLSLSNPLKPGVKSRMKM